MSSYQQEKAFSLLEMLLVLAIASLLILFSTRFFSVVSRERGISKTLEDIKIIRQAAAEWELGQGDYTGISMTVLNNAGLLPRDLGTGVGKTAWGSNYTIAPTTTNTSQLSLSLTSSSETASALPIDACNNLKNALQNQAISMTPTDCSATPYNFIIVFG